MTFREYIRERYGHQAADDGKDPFALVIYDILNDRTFPDQENDGLMVRSYIRDRQLFPRDKRQAKGNREIVEAFEDLWIVYKADTGQYPTRPVKYN